MISFVYGVLFFSLNFVKGVCCSPVQLLLIGSAPILCFHAVWSIVGALSLWPSASSCQQTEPVLYYTTAVMVGLEMVTFAAGCPIVILMWKNIQFVRDNWVG